METIGWTLRDSRGNEVAKGHARLSALGAFDLALKLPPTMNLGQAALQLGVETAALRGAAHTHGFQVQEFRRPEFEVKAATTSEGPFVVGGHATVDVTAAYYAGGALPGADVSWRVESTPRRSARPTATTSCSARSCRGGSGTTSRLRPACRASPRAPTARAATACASTSRALTRRGRGTSRPRPR